MSTTTQAPTVTRTADRPAATDRRHSNRPEAHWVVMPDGRLTCLWETPRG